MGQRNGTQRSTGFWVVPSLGVLQHVSPLPGYDISTYQASTGDLETHAPSIVWNSLVCSKSVTSLSTFTGTCTKHKAILDTSNNHIFQDIDIPLWLVSNGRSWQCLDPRHIFSAWPDFLWFNRYKQDAGSRDRGMLRSGLKGTFHLMGLSRMYK